MLSLALAFAFLFPADDAWPDFRGPNRQGHGSARAKLPLEWSEEKNVAWKTAVHGKGWSSPVVLGEQVWMTTATEDGKEMSVVALDLDSGKVVHDRVIFEVEEPAKWRNDMNSYASPSPVIEEGRVYVHFGTYGTACLDTKTAKTLWQRRDVNCDHMEGPGSSPILFEDLLIVNMDGGDVQYVIALDKKSGETVWKTDRSFDFTEFIPDARKAYSTPILVGSGDDLQLISTGAQATASYDPRTGEELWWVRHIGFSMSSRPIAGDGLVYLNTGFMRPSLLAVRTGALAEGEERIAWTNSRAIPSIPSPVLVDGRIYLVNDQGIGSCIDAETGESIWRERLGGAHAASLLHAGGRIYAFDRAGKTTVFAPGGDELELLAENHLDHGFMASPAVVGDALIVRTEKHVYRLEER